MQALLKCLVCADCGRLLLLIQQYKEAVEANQRQIAASAELVLPMKELVRHSFGTIASSEMAVR